MAALSPVWRTVRVHDDDVHGLIPVSDDYFLSGSKDGTAKVWDKMGRCEDIHTFSPRIDYRLWVTALAKSAAGPIFVGLRSGSLWKIAGAFPQKVWEHQDSDENLGCKERNLSRINCIAEIAHSIYIGVASKFIELDNFFNPTSECQTDPRDWVYCIHPLTESKLLTVTGEVLCIWEKTSKGWTPAQPIQKKGAIQPQRPFISSITPIGGPLWGAAVFDGSVRVYNVEAPRLVHQFQEHLGRVWMVIPLEEQTLASSGEDGTVKFWDLRCQTSVGSIDQFPGRVSALLKSDPTKLVTASCPSDVRRSHDKAELALWDLRA